MDKNVVFLLWIYVKIHNDTNWGFYWNRSSSKYPYQQLSLMEKISANFLVQCSSLVSKRPLYYDNTALLGNRIFQVSFNLPELRKRNCFISKYEAFTDPRASLSETLWKKCFFWQLCSIITMSWLTPQHHHRSKLSGCHWIWSVIPILSFT